MSCYSYAEASGAFKLIVIVKVAAIVVEFIVTSPVVVFAVRPTIQQTSTTGQFSFELVKLMHQ